MKISLSNLGLTVHFLPPHWTHRPCYEIIPEQKWRWNTLEIGNAVARITRSDWKTRFYTFRMQPYWCMWRYLPGQSIINRDLTSCMELYNMALHPNPRNLKEAHSKIGYRNKIFADDIVLLYVIFDLYATLPVLKLFSRILGEPIGKRNVRFVEGLSFPLCLDESWFDSYFLVPWCRVWIKRSHWATRLAYPR